jgi:hypothetical protein
VSDNQLQKRESWSLKDRGQYLLAFGVVASMLWVANFPIFVIFFFGIFAYFLLRMFSSTSRSETREIFEFYLTANEILRDDERRWYGFEIKEAIRRGEDIARRMSGAPPLVHFALGALQNKVGDHKAAIANLAYIVENSNADEASYAFPSDELRSYVKILRKIEREPADAPLTSAAVRALERARKIRAALLLEDSRQKFSAIPVVNEPQMIHAAAYQADGDGTTPVDTEVSDSSYRNGSMSDKSISETFNGASTERRRSKKEADDPFSDRKSISEVLHDIYDKNVQ